VQAPVQTQDATTTITASKRQLRARADEENAKARQERELPGKKRSRPIARREASILASLSLRDDPVKAASDAITMQKATQMQKQKQKQKLVKRWSEQSESPGDTVEAGALGMEAVDDVGDEIDNTSFTAEQGGDQAFKGAADEEPSTVSADTKQETCVSAGYNVSISMTKWSADSALSPGEQIDMEMDIDETDELGSRDGSDIDETGFEEREREKERERERERERETERDSFQLQATTIDRGSCAFPLLNRGLPTSGFPDLRLISPMSLDSSDEGDEGVTGLILAHMIKSIRNREEKRKTRKSRHLTSQVHAGIDAYLREWEVSVQAELSGRKEEVHRRSNSLHSSAAAFGANVRRFVAQIDVAVKAARSEAAHVKALDKAAFSHIARAEEEAKTDERALERQLQKLREEILATTRKDVSAAGQRARDEEHRAQSLELRAALGAM
jgi:hypothetical protein